MPESTSRKLRILVVDDEPLVGECIMGLLKFYGHEVQAVTSSETALGMFEAGKFDLIFMDYSMPGMKGDELAMGIRALAPDQPIVMVTGNSPPFVNLPYVNFIIPKPVMLEDLQRAIVRLEREQSFIV